MQCADSSMMQETEHQLRSQEQTLSTRSAATEAALENANAELVCTQERLQKTRTEKRVLQQRQADEMDRVEDRVKAAIQRKDETIALLRNQLADLQNQMRNAESMLTLE